MTKPPPDVDPEKFIIGKGAYTNFHTEQFVFDGRLLRLEPEPLPIVSVCLLNLVFIAFFVSTAYALRRWAHDLNVGWTTYLPPVLGLLTCVGSTMLVYRLFDKARRLGTQLTYDTVGGRLTLPREGVSFDRNEIVQLQYVTSKFLQFGNQTTNVRPSELNLITDKNGERKRWPLLRSSFTVRAFDRRLRPVVANTDLPVVRVTDELLGWRIEERPFVCQPAV